MKFRMTKADTDALHADETMWNEEFTFNSRSILEFFPEVQDSSGRILAPDELRNQDGWMIPVWDHPSLIEICARRGFLA